MPGKWITDKQVKLYMTSRESGNTQALSSAKAGVSVRTARDIEHGKRQLPQTQARHWRTRKDPLEAVWSSELEPMLSDCPELQAITLLEYLQAKYPGEYGDKLLRTLQRRVKRWRIVKGPAIEVMFRQTHEPGHLGLSDFTRLKQTAITIAGQVFEHLLYHFRLIYSKWSSVKVITGGESFSALAEGLQSALAHLGGAPLEHRTDSLSAAFKNLSLESADDMTERYKALCAHYQMKSSRNNLGRGHENGGIESAHGHIKRRIEQALLLRGSNDFTTVADYQAFIDEVVAAHNARNANALSIEKPLLQPLPEIKTVDYTQVQAVVTSSSTIDVRRVTYTVPSQLQGQTLQVRLYDDRLECYLGCDRLITLTRVYSSGNTTRTRLVDYRHVIHSLVKKPQAFRYSQIRDDLLPNDRYRMIWQHVDNAMEAKAACRFMVGLLHLAAVHDREEELADRVLTNIRRGQSLTLSQLQSQFDQPPMQIPTVNVMQHTLDQYNDLITMQEVNHG
jgi:hypothetical protein